MALTPAPYSPWNQILSNLHSTHFPLERLRVGWHEESWPDDVSVVGQLPPFLQVCAALGTRLYHDDAVSRLAILAPHWGEGAFWLAVGCALCRLREDFLEAQKQPLRFKEGQRLRFDRNHVVEFAGMDGESILLRSRDGSIEAVPRAWRARLSPDNSHKNLSNVDFKTLWRDVKASPLDELLDVRTCGSLSFLKTRVIFVGAINRSREMARWSWIAAQSDNRFALPSATLETLQSIHAYLCEERSNGTINYAPSETALKVEKALRAAQRPLNSSNVREITSDIAGDLRTALNALRLRPSYKPAIPLESLIESVRQQAMAEQNTVASAPCAPATLWDVLPWSRIDFEGRVRRMNSQTSLVNAPILLANDAMAVREYIDQQTPGEPRPLMIFDGSGGFRTRASVWQDVLEQQAPVVVCLDRDDRERTRIGERRFTFWDWSKQDLTALGAAPHENAYPVPAFESIERMLRSSSHRLETNLAHDSALEEVTEWVFYLADELKSCESLPSLFRLRGELAGVVLALVRRVCPATLDETNQWREKVERVRALAYSSRNYLDDQWYADLEYSLNRLQDLWDDAHTAKQNVLNSLWPELREEGVTRVHVVVAREGDKNSSALLDEARNAGVHLSSGTRREKVVWGSDPAEATALVVVGWLSESSMRTWLSGVHTSRTHVVGFDFELGWLRRAQRRWRKEERLRTDETFLSPSQKRLWLSFDGVPTDAPPLREEVWEQIGSPFATDELPLDDNETESTDDVPVEVSSYPYESSNEPEVAARRVRALRLDWGEREREWQRESWAVNVAPRRGESSEQGHLIELGGGYTVFVGDSFRLPIVTARVLAQLNSENESGETREKRGEEERKTWAELAVGDWVVLREERTDDDRDVLRELADAELEKAGFVGQRDVARRWKTALRLWLEERQLQGLSRNGALEDLRSAGLNRSVQTLRGWIEGEHTIGPQNEEKSIALIAEITAHPDLLGDERTVIDAIQRVRTAHHRAADLLSQKLADAIATWKASDEAAPELDFLPLRVEGRSAIVARVLNIDEHPTTVAVSRLNLLMSPAQDDIAVPSPDEYESRAPQAIFAKEPVQEESFLEELVPLENSRLQPLQEPPPQSSPFAELETLVDRWCQLEPYQLERTLSKIPVPLLDTHPLRMWIECETAHYVHRAQERRTEIWQACDSGLRCLPPPGADPETISRWQKQTRDSLRVAAFPGPLSV